MTFELTCNNAVMDDFAHYRYRRKDESCLDMAKSSNYGSYADMEVVERRDMALFFCVVLCLVPVGFATKLPLVSSIKDHIKVTSLVA